MIQTKDDIINKHVKGCMLTKVNVQCKIYVNWNALGERLQNIVMLSMGKAAC